MGKRQKKLLGQKITEVNYPGWAQTSGVYVFCRDCSKLIGFSDTCYWQLRGERTVIKCGGCVNHEEKPR